MCHGHISRYFVKLWEKMLPIKKYCNVTIEGTNCLHVILSCIFFIIYYLNLQKETQYDQSINWLASVSSIPLCFKFECQ